METTRLWPPGGDYLHKLTLQILARCVTGCDLPHILVDSHTFEDSCDPSRDVEAGMILGADVLDIQRNVERRMSRK